MSSIFALLTDYTYLVVIGGSAILGLTGGVLGCFAVQTRQGLLGDGISHAALPGIVLAFLVTGSAGIGVLLTGAATAGLVSALLILFIVHFSKIKADSALAVVMSSFFGVGIALLTGVQRSPGSGSAGLGSFLYGQASALTADDILAAAVCQAVVLGLVTIFWKELKLVTFDEEYARSLGLPVVGLKCLLMLMLSASIVVGLQTVGVVLMSAMLIAPAVSARQWCSGFFSMTVLAAVFGAASGAVGAMFSAMVEDMPTGPAIVVCCSAIAVVSILFAPGRGILSKIAHQIAQRRNFRNDC